MIQVRSEDKKAPIPEKYFDNFKRIMSKYGNMNDACDDTLLCAIK